MSFHNLKKHLEARDARKDKKSTKNPYVKNATKTEIGGYSFGSKLEASVFNILHTLKLAGEISEIQVQPQVYLTDAEILFKPDFKVIKQCGDFYFVEAKGFKTAVYQIKRRLWKYYGPGELHVYEGSHVNPKLSEIVKQKEKK